MNAATTTTIDFEDVVPSGRSRVYLESLGAKIAGKLQCEPGSALEPVVERIGGKIEVRSWKEPFEDGSIQVRGPNDFTIYLSPFTGPIRNRFTIAHELGHYFIHSLVGQKPIFIRREGSDRPEWEANWFAAGFLMPKDIFEEKWGSEGDVDALATYFNVSRQAIRIRRKTLESGLQE